MKTFFLMSLLLLSVAFADEYDKAIKGYKDSPSDINTEVKWIDPYDKAYYPYDRCSNVEKLEVTKLEEKVKYYYEHKSDFFSIDHFHCLVGIVRVTYKVTCSNKLQYKGVSYLITSENDVHKLNETWVFSQNVEDEFKSHAHDWVDKPLDYLSASGEYYDKLYPEFTDYPKFDVNSLKTRWTKQKVGYPEWSYTGEAGKTLAQPVLFIHGLGSDFEVWGVEALADKGKDGINKGNPDFQNGLVKKYERGSAPDILARTNGLNVSEENINKNGIYFFQAPGKLKNGKWEEAKPNWNPNASDVQTSQSRKLYDQLKKILDDFYGSKKINGKPIDWTKTEGTPIHLVAHSQGGLVVREMLRGLKADEDKIKERGLANPANHIGKFITVDTPHFGSELAVNDTKDIEKDFPGLKLIIDDLDAQDRGETVEHTLVEAKLDMYWLDYANRAAGDLVDGWDSWIGADGPQAILAVLNPMIASLGWSYAATTDAFTDLNLVVKGPYIGKYKAYTTVDGPIDFDGPEFEIKKLEEVSEQLREIRRGAKHLDKNSTFMRQLTEGHNNSGAYPRRPDDQNVSLLPLYSPKTKRLLAKILNSVADGADHLCADIADDSDGCFVIGPLFRDKAIEMAGEKDMEIVDVSETQINGELWDALVDIQNTWFDKSDALVSEESQKFVNTSLGLDPKKIKAFSEPRQFLFHNALTPWEDVLHGPANILDFEVDGASRQGLDIACALNDYCNQVAEKDQSKIMYLNYGSVSFTGDFDVAPLYLNQGTQEVQISDGTNYLKALYVPGTGSVVRYTDDAGNEVEDVIYDGSVSTSPAISRTNQTIHVSFNNQSGKSFTKDYVIANMADVATYSIVANDVSDLSKAVVAVGSATDPSSQTPPEEPKTTVTTTKKYVFAYHREARGKHEANTSRPRILVANTSDSDIHGFKVAYYFTADPVRVPVVEIDDPKAPVKVENIGGDKWRFIIDASNGVLKSKSVYPNIDGWQIRIHYADWADYSHHNDWSSNYNMGQPLINKKIVVYDMNGNILWGVEPDYSQKQDEDNSALEATMTWFDEAPWEANTLKPHVAIKNTGSVPFKDFYAKLWFRVPTGKQLYIPVDDWYTPVSTPSVANVGDGVWELKLHFTDYILYPGQTIEDGAVGLHLIDWSTFDKNVCGFAVTDSDGNIIFSSNPSVEGCKETEDSHNQNANISATMEWFDSAPWEMNTLKPRVTIQNTGSVPLKKFYAKLWFRIPDGKQLNLPIDDWYTPVSIPSVVNVGEKVWELRYYFDNYTLYPGESVQGGDVGLHLVDWSLFDKTVCGFAITDVDDNVIFGSIPSVEMCKSYNSPNLIQSLYAWNS